MAPNMFGMPDNPVTDAVIETAYGPAPGVVIAYPSFDDWLSLYNFDGSQTSKGEAWNQSQHDNMQHGHERSVREQLDVIFRHSVGRAVLAEGRFNAGMTVRIFPYDFQRSSSWSADTVAITTSRNSRDAWDKNLPMIGATFGGKPFSRSDKTTSKPMTGRGIGSDSDIFYTSRRVQGLKQPDETLLHELVHAGRNSRGIHYNMPVSGGYGNQEEFLAVTIANMYKSQKGRPLYDYHGNPINPATFLDSNLSPTPRLVLAMMRTKQRSLFDALARLTDAPFNPFHEVDAASSALINRIERQ